MDTDKIYAQKVASEYSKQQTSKAKALKRLDAWVKKPAKIFAYIFGSVSTLLLGVGMCLAMEVLGNATPLMMVIGIFIGLLGIAGVSTNYFIYKRILNKRKQQNANDVLVLAKEVMEEE